MRNIIFLCTQMEAGGAQNKAYSMYEKAVEEGYDAYIVFLYKKRPTFLESNRVICLSPHPPRSFGQYVDIFRSLWNLFRQLKPEAVIGFAQYAAPIASIYGTLWRAKFRVGTQTNPHSTVPRGAWLADLFCGIFGIYTSNICASAAIKADFKLFPKAYRRKLDVVYNGIKIHKNNVTKKAARELLNISLEKNIALTVGRLSEQKNHRFIIKLAREMKNVDFYFVGDGELRSELQELAEEFGVASRVHFVGEVPFDDVGLYIRASDVFLFPSLYEAFGLAVVEAMAGGLPVIASAHPALKEVIGGGGTVVDLSSPETWKGCIEEALNGNSTIEEKTRIGFVRARQFSTDAMWDGYKRHIGR